MSDHTLYFTISTIAQCAAICFVFLGAFVMFRLQATDVVLKELAHHLVAITTRARINTEIPGLIAARKYEQAYEQLKVPGNPSETLQGNHSAIMAELLDAIELRLRFKALVAPSLGLIGASAIALALVDHYATNPSASTIVIILLLAWFLRVLMMMEKLIRCCFTH